MAKVAFSSYMGGLSGSTGNTVFVTQENGATLLRQRVMPHDPETPKQVAQRNRMTQARSAFRDLTPSEVQSWKEYAQRIAAPRSIARACDAFISLALRFLAVSPNQPIPRTPPADTFLGDSIKVNATGAVGSVVFASPTASTTGIVAEVLLVSVATWAATPNEHAFRHCAFVSFPPGGGQASIPRTAGRYAPAVRFIDITTGQASRLVRLDGVEVE